MITGMLDAVSAYRKATSLPQEIAPVGGATAAKGGDFSSMMAEFATDTVDQLKKAESVSAQGVLGKANPVDIATAVGGAETTLQLLATLRDKMINAYQEVTRMSV